MALVTRTSSVAALASAGTSALWLLFLNEGRMLLLVVILTILVYIRHSENLKRIKEGTEPKIGQKKPAETGAAP
jgi:glycerol-3-phosphate acyltransferase PlsY